MQIKITIIFYNLQYFVNFRIVLIFCFEKSDYRAK